MEPKVESNQLDGENITAKTESAGLKSQPYQSNDNKPVAKDQPIHNKIGLRNQTYGKKDSREMPSDKTIRNKT